MYYVYVLRSLKDQTTYIGFTEDLESRLQIHNSGKTKSIRHKLPMELIYFEAYRTKTQARKREIELKKSSYAKERLFKRILVMETVDG